MPDDPEAMVDAARRGDRNALERLVAAVQTPIYNLALRMLWHPEEARDATQEILVRIITHLGTFRGDSRFTTWCYRIAANYLLTARRSRLESQRLTFEGFARDLGEGAAPLSSSADDWPADRAVLLEELKVGCMHALLTCLERPERLAYILGEIFELDGNEGAAVLGITPEAFRQRLARARRSVVEFTRAHCGLVDPANACRCASRLPRALQVGRVNPDALLFAGGGPQSDFPVLLKKVRQLDVERRTALLYRDLPRPDAGPELLAAIQRALDA